MDSALSGVIVLDLTADIAGPYACMLLGDMGAEVITVELADSPDWRGYLPSHLWNRGKKSIYLDLSKEGGREPFDALVARADVLVESFLPSEALQRHLDYDSLSHLNPRLIYCALPPFGERGPLSDKPADDGVVAAFSGIMGEQTGEYLPPEFVTVPMASSGTAFLASYAISSALYVRELEGIGQKIEVPLLSGAMAMQSGHFIKAPGVDHIGGPTKDRKGPGSVYHLYECSDGEWVFISITTQTFWNRLCITLGLEEFLTDPRFENAPWSFQEEDRNYLISTFTDIMKGQTRDYWLKLFEERDLPSGPVATRDEFIEDPQVVHNNMIVGVEDPLFGITQQVGIPVSLSEMPGMIKGPAPDRGQHGEEILMELGYTRSQLTQLKSSGVVIC